MDEQGSAIALDIHGGPTRLIRDARDSDLPAMRRFAEACDGEGKAAAPTPPAAA
jgi:hypothetical protein